VQRLHRQRITLLLSVANPAIEQVHGRRLSESIILKCLAVATAATTTSEHRVSR